MSKACIDSRQYPFQRRRKKKPLCKRTIPLDQKLVALVVLVLLISIIFPSISWLPFVTDDSSKERGDRRLHHENSNLVARNGTESERTKVRPLTPAKNLDPKKRFEILRRRAGTVCRIPEVCIYENGTSSIPSWLVSHKAMLTRYCGLEKVAYREANYYGVQDVRVIERDLVLPGDILSNSDIRVMRDLRARGYFSFDRAVTKIALVSDQSSTGYTCWDVDENSCQNYRTIRIAPVAMWKSKEGLEGYSDMLLLKRMMLAFRTDYRLLELDAVFHFTDKICFRSALFTTDATFIPTPSPTAVPGQRRRSRHEDRIVSPIASPASSPNASPTRTKSNTEKLMGKVEDLAPPEVVAPLADDTHANNVDFSKGGVEYFWFKGKEKVAVCRIYRACLSQDGQIIAPSLISSQISMLRKRCGCRKLRTKRSGFFDHYQETSRLDLFNDGTALPRLAPDFIHTFLPALTSLAALYSNNSRMFSRRCLTSEDKYLRACSHSHVQPKPAMFLNASLVHSGRQTHWINLFVHNLLPPKPDGPKVLAWELSKAKMMCFRSIAIAPDRFPVSETLSSSHVLYKSNNLTRTKLVAQAKYQKEHSCRLKFLVLNAHATRVLVNGEQSPLITELAAIKEAIDVRGADSNFTRFGGVTASITDHYPGDSSFRKTIEELQKCNVLVLAHGVGIMNLLFLQRQALAIEIVPFGLRAPIYHQFARSCDARFIRIVGRPDEHTFVSCIGRKNRKLIKEYRKVVRRYLRFDHARHEGLFYEDEEIDRFVDCDIGGDLREKCELCLKEQRLQIDVGQLTWLVMREGVRVCYDKKIRYSYP